MQTNFTQAQLADPGIAESEAVIRKCVHCGFCTATCPTYVLLGDELDSPRGRIYLIKDMLENERQPTEDVVRHIDRCLSCLSCMTTCPSGVNYMHLVDHARAYIERNYRRPWSARLVRALLAAILPNRTRFRLALRLAVLARPFAPLIARLSPLKAFAAMLDLAPKQIPAAVSPAMGAVRSPRGRVAMLRGCVEPVLKPGYQSAAARLINRMGFEICYAGEGCCGALVNHMGKEDQALASARRNIDRWFLEIEAGGLDAILVTASGCGTFLKDYGFLLRHDPVYARKAAQISALVKDVTEWLDEAGLPPGKAPELRVAYHPACSLQHGQQITDAPARLLSKAGFAVSYPAEAHLCCGSAGTYNILEPDIAARLRDRKLANIGQLDADIIATGNIGCATHLAQKADIPIVHTVELLDWATGGPAPAGAEVSKFQNSVAAPPR